MQDSEEIYHNLPFEVAHGVVRTLVQHLSQFQEAKVELARLLEEDPSSKKKKTQTLSEKVQKWRRVDKFIVMNRRTGQVATPEWLGKHVGEDAEGRPCMKNPKSTARAWILTLRCLVDEGDQVFSIALQTKADSSFRNVRCLELRTGLPEKGIDFLMGGYQHILDPEDGPEPGKEFMSTLVFTRVVDVL